MSSGYVPLFGSLTTGTLCGRWPDVGLWPIVLSLADRHGVIDVTPTYLSSVTGLPVDDVVACMARFCQPDPASRSADEGGARLHLIDSHREWGWVVVNHGKYRERARLMSKDAERTANGVDKARKQTERAKSKASGNVPRCPPESPVGPLSDSDSDSDSESRKKKSEDKLAEARSVAGLNLEAFGRWIDYRKEIGKAVKPASLVACAEKLAAFGNQQAAVVQHSIANSYQGLFAPKASEQNTRPPEGPRSREFGT